MMKIQTVTDDFTFITSFVNYTNLLLLTTDPRNGFKNMIIANEVRLRVIAGHCSNLTFASF